MTMKDTSPFDIGVFTEVNLAIVRFDVRTKAVTISGGYSPAQARVLAALIVGACDVAEGKVTTDAAHDFLAASNERRDQGKPS